MQTLIDSCIVMGATQSTIRQLEQVGSEEGEGEEKKKRGGREGKRKIREKKKLITYNGME